MKQFLTALILSMFCINPCIYAEEIITADSNNNSQNYALGKGFKYENGQFVYIGNDKNVETQQETQDNTKFGQTSSQTTTNSNNKQISNTDSKKIATLQKYKPVMGPRKYVKENPTEDNEISSTELNKKIKTYQSGNLKLLKKEPSSIKYSKFYKQIQCKSKPVKIVLLNGDYISWDTERSGDFYVWQKGKTIQYAAEYHKDNSLMGIIKLVRINKNTYGFYEYRIPDENNDIAYLTHVMLYYDDSHKSSFIYSKSGKLRVCMLDNNTYVVDLDTIPTLKILDFSILDNQKQVEILYTGKMILCGIIALPLAPILMLWAFSTNPT